MANPVLRERIQKFLSQEASKEEEKTIKSDCDHDRRSQLGLLIETHSLNNHSGMLQLNIEGERRLSYEDDDCKESSSDSDDQRFKRLDDEE